MLHLDRLQRRAYPAHRAADLRVSYSQICLRNPLVFRSGVANPTKNLCLVEKRGASAFVALQSIRNLHFICLQEVGPDGDAAAAPRPCSRCAGDCRILDSRRSVQLLYCANLCATGCLWRGHVRTSRGGGAPARSGRRGARDRQGRCAPRKQTRCDAIDGPGRHSEGGWDRSRVG
jgi:hypothetical protein